MKWERVKLTEVCDFHGGTQPPKSEWSSEKKDGYVRMLQIRDFTQGKDSFIEYVKDSKTLKKCTERDILIGRYGASIGKILTGLRGAYNVALVKTLPSKHLDRQYLYFFLNTPYFQNFIQNAGSRAAQAGFNKDELSNLEISLPPLYVQQQIANTLDKANALQQKDQQLLQKYDELAQSIFYEMFGDPVRNERGWICKRLSDCVTGKSGIKAGPFGSSLKKEFYVSSGYKIYGQEQVIADDLDFGDYYIDKEKYRELESCKVNAGDVLISMVGTFGKVSVVPENFQPGIINPRLVKLTFDKLTLNPYFFKFFFQLPEAKKALSNVSRGGTMDIINAGILKELEVITPPIEDQLIFIEKLNRIIQSKALVSVVKSSALFDNLINQSFS